MGGRGKEKKNGPKMWKKCESIMINVEPGRNFIIPKYVTYPLSPK